MFKSLYAWVLRLADSPRAPWALGLVAFAESSFFPVPPDIILVPMVLARPERAWRYAAIATIASVLGGMVGYAIGALLFDTLGQWLIHLYGYADKLEALREFYAKWGALFILIKGLTPIPYKLVTIVSGLLSYNFGLFVLLSLLTRGIRFFVLAAILGRFGVPIKAALDRHFGLILISFVAIVVIGFWIAIKWL
ncbi:DedA family protein [Lichenihabitans sp. PAMC28606]|uniref:YqaA family protein n=1 Tax=Lichenihabitans sp. PAMC28606 TaxID=2880932 RepID=UPI001D09AF1C|nr:YqaA family protein [Lichenihabitans sp. PAMC28606]UDL95724.1 DedA family protein [Lichenihabitans sp. PAMC28606]